MCTNLRKCFDSNNWCSLFTIFFLKSCQLNQERGDSNPRGLRLQKSHPRGSSVCSNRSELTTRSYVPLLYHARALCSTTGNSYSVCSDSTKSSLLFSLLTLRELSILLQVTPTRPLGHANNHLGARVPSAGHIL